MRLQECDSRPVFWTRVLRVLPISLSHSIVIVAASCPFSRTHLPSCSECRLAWRRRGRHLLYCLPLPPLSSTSFPLRRCRHGRSLAWWLHPTEVTAPFLLRSIAPPPSLISSASSREQFGAIFLRILSIRRSNCSGRMANLD